MKISFVRLFILLIIANSLVGAHDSEQPVPFIIKIEKDKGRDGIGVYHGSTIQIDVSKISGSEAMLGFDFLIAFDTGQLSFQGIAPGEIFNIPGDYEWDIFDYQFVPDEGYGDICPNGLIRVRGKADSSEYPRQPRMDGDIPKCVSDSTILFSIDFHVSNNRSLECEILPISFFWRGCRDNIITFSLRDSGFIRGGQAVSLAVYDANDLYCYPEYKPIEMPIDINEQAFPNFYGAIESCLKHDTDNPSWHPTRCINFYNGGAELFCLEGPYRGDLNLNGKESEQADIIIYIDYFIRGRDAFTINMEGQIATSDVNYDGIPLTVADFVYLLRIITDDSKSYPPLSPAPEIVHFGHYGRKITVDTELGAAYFVFRGDVPFTLGPGASHMNLESHFDGQQTRAFIFSLDRGNTFKGDILSVAESPIWVEAATYDGQPLRIELNPFQFAVKSEPNPFSPLSGQMEFQLHEDQTVIIEIFDMSGRRVRELSLGNLPRGDYMIRWDGKDDAAVDQSSGIYFYKVIAGNNTRTRKMILLR